MCFLGLHVRNSTLEVFAQRCQLGGQLVGDTGKVVFERSEVGTTCTDVLLGVRCLVPHGPPDSVVDIMAEVINHSGEAFEDLLKTRALQNGDNLGVPCEHFDVPTLLSTSSVVAPSGQDCRELIGLDSLRDHVVEESHDVVTPLILEGLTGFAADTFQTILDPDKSRSNLVSGSLYDICKCSAQFVFSVDKRLFTP